MTHLLPLPAEGLGTENVEGLASFFARLAEVHLLSPYQLAGHLAAWTGIGGSTHRKTPNFGGRNAMLINGFGAPAECAVSWLNMGLSDKRLSSLTLLCLKNILPIDGRSALKLHRAWCPACLAEAKAQSNIYYEKLAWLIKPITRCHVHDVALEETCPNCGALQLSYFGGVPLSTCSVCNGELMSSPKQWIHRAVPSRGEREMLGVLAHASKNPGFCYSASAPKEFVEQYLARTNQEEMDIFKARFGSDRFRNLFNARGRMTLNSLIDLSLATEVPLHEMLLCPADAAQVARLHATFSDMAGPSQRKFPSRSKRKDVGAALYAALDDAADDSPIALKQLCRALGVSSQCAHHWFPIESAQMIEHRQAWLDHQRKKNAEITESCVRLQGLPNYLSKAWKTQDDVVGYLCAEYKLSKRMVRAELSRQLTEHMTRISTEVSFKNDSKNH